MSEPGRDLKERCVTLSMFVKLKPTTPGDYCCFTFNNGWMYDTTFFTNQKEDKQREK